MVVVRIVAVAVAVAVAVVVVVVVVVVIVVVVIVAGSRSNSRSSSSSSRRRRRSSSSSSSSNRSDRSGISSRCSSGIINSRSSTAAVAAPALGLRGFGCLNFDSGWRKGPSHTSGIEPAIFPRAPHETAARPMSYPTIAQWAGGCLTSHYGRHPALAGHPALGGHPALIGHPALKAARVWGPLATVQEGLIKAFIRA